MVNECVRLVLQFLQSNAHQFPASAAQFQIEVAVVGPPLTVPALPPLPVLLGDYQRMRAEEDRRLGTAAALLVVRAAKQECSSQHAS